MDIDKDIIEENAMSGKIKIIEKIGGGNTTESDSPENCKSKKRSESSLGQVDPKNVKIAVPSSKRDKTSMSDLSNILTKQTVYLEKEKKHYLDLYSKLLK